MESFRASKRLSACVDLARDDKWTDMNVYCYINIRTLYYNTVPRKQLRTRNDLNANDCLPDALKKKKKKIQRSHFGSRCTSVEHHSRALCNSSLSLSLLRSLGTQFCIIIFHNVMRVDRGKEKDSDKHARRKIVCEKESERWIVFFFVVISEDYRAKQLFLLRHHTLHQPTPEPNEQMMFYWRFCLKTNSSLFIVRFPLRFGRIFVFFFCFSCDDLLAEYIIYSCA